MEPSDPQENSQRDGRGNDEESPATAASPSTGSRTDTEWNSALDNLHPPRSRGEMLRDWILRLLDSRCCQILGFFVLFLVVADGALFFFFLMGWQSLCRPRTDCDPRNQIYNIAVQILNALFTYMAIVAMPWRCANGIHVFGYGLPPRDNSDGKDLYGTDSQDVWFHIPLRHRRIITTTLLLNCLFQFVNQGTRIVFRSYGLQNVFPGNLWVNVFFGLSMLCAAIGAVHLVIVESNVRQQNPELFEPGPIQQLSAWWKRKRQSQHETNPSEAAAVDSSRRDVMRDPTQAKGGSVLGSSGESVRGGLRMFGL